MTRYRILFLAAWAVLVLAARGRSDEIYVLDNQPSVGTCNGFPFHTVSIASQEKRFQVYIGAQHLPARACTITHVSFAPCDSLVFSAPTFEMRMSHTTLKQPLGTFASNLPNPISVVPTRSIVLQRTKDQWSSIKFVNPFHYNGTDHLMLELRFKGAAAGSRMDHTAAYIAPGLYRVYTIGNNAYNAPLGLVDIHAPPKLRLTTAIQYIVGSGVPSIGGTVSLNLDLPRDAGVLYQVGTSLGDDPLNIGNRQLNLSVDSLLVLSVSNRLPMIFRRYTGYLDKAGKAMAAIAIPNARDLIGIRLYSAFVTIKPGAPFNISSISNTYVFTIMK